jgi:hypothetical protein
VVQEFPESGSVQIGSTLWNWSISEVRSLPEGTVSYANLDFHAPENERNTMYVGLNEPFSPSTVDEIRELGRNPDERRLIAPLMGQSGFLTLCVLHQKGLGLVLTAMGECSVRLPFQKV